MKKRVPPLNLSPTRAPPPEHPWETPEEVFLLYDGGWTFSFDPPTYKARRYLAAKQRNLVHMVPAKTLEKEVEALYHWKDRAEAAEDAKWKLISALESIVDCCPGHLCSESLPCGNCQTAIEAIQEAKGNKP